MIDITSTTPKKLCQYAQDTIGGRWPEAEQYIVNDPKWAYHYAKNVIKDRWPEAEEIIMKDPYLAYRYAKFILMGSESTQKMTPVELTLFKLKYSEYL